MTVQFLHDLTWPEVAGLDPGSTIAVLPLGATEQHGPHLPLITDRALVDAVIERAIEFTPEGPTILVLPTQPVGLSIEHAAFAGTLTASAETLLRLWTEIGACIARVGIRKLVLLNGHGGQSHLVGLVAQQLRSHHDMIVAPHHCYRVWRENERLSADERLHGIHAGAVETALMRAIRPDLVRDDRVADFPTLSRDIEATLPALAPDGRIAFAWDMDDLNPDGAAGDARRGEASIGESLLFASAQAFAATLADLVKLDPNTIKRRGPDG